MAKRSAARLLIEEAQKTRATSLDLSGKCQVELPRELNQLSQLKILDISGNDLAKLPDSLAQLARLESLDLSNNRFTSVPEWLSRLTNLKYLNLSGNQVALLPESIGALTKLEHLALSDCQLISLPDGLGQLVHLRTLDLAGNRLIKLPQSLQSLVALEELYLHGNEALGLPFELLGPSQEDVRQKHGEQFPASRILDYYFRASIAGRPLNEARLTVVGRGGVGKTSIIHRLVSDVFKETTITTGIEITDWNISLADEDSVRLHIWDFGGQEILHATHQLFLAARSLYLVVLSGREVNATADAEYWLKLIGIFGNDSPVILVLNKIKTGRFDVNRKQLQQKYPAIRAFVDTDCRDGTGLPQLREAIAHETARLPYLHSIFPASWFTIKDRLAALSKDFLSYDEYREQCSELGEQDPESQKALASVLHSLGIAVNYADDVRLQDTYVLNPRWLTDPIYRILESQKIRARKGEIQLSDLSEILDRKVYPARIYRFLFDLMKRFELCFSYPDDDTRYLIPELLDSQQPADSLAFNRQECLNFEYHYDVLPSGVLPRFIVRTHTLSEGLPRWRTGVILRFEANHALVTADLVDRKVRTSISGPPSGRRPLLGIIRSDFERIHRDFPKLEVQEMVPLPDRPDVLMSYRELLGLEQSGMQRVPKLVDDQIVELEVQQLLNGVDLEGVRRGSKARLEEGRPAKVFYSYSHKDENLRNEFETHLKLLQRMGLIETWHDRMIEAGDDWRRQINENLERADIIVFLISPDFIASDYCYEKEMVRGLERNSSGLARVIPVVLRDVNWKVAPFSDLQELPKDGLPVTRWADRDSAWRNVAEGLERVIRQRREGKEERAQVLSIAGVSLKNIRCFENLRLSFVSDSRIRKFNLLFGDNGVGKSTLLRSIALGLCDATTATALMESLPGPLMRRNTDRGQITIDFVSSTSGAKWTVETVLRRTKKGMVLIEQSAPPNFPRDQIFACAYGAGRLRFGTQDYAGYSLKNSLGTLFNYESSLQNPELAFRRIESQGVNLNELTNAIDAVLMLQPGDTNIDSSGIRVRGPWGDFTPMGGLGDGFQATLGWIADLFGWALFYSGAAILDGISGMVLIDEIEQHLHPSWQREIVRLLHQQFPGIQFIATSHSPMSALGTTALPESLTQVVRLRQMDDSVETTTLTVPKGQRADQVLTSPLFGLFSASGFDVAADIERYTELASRKMRSEAENAEFIELGKRVESALGPFRSDLERRIDESVREAVHKEVGDLLESGKLTNEALDLQIRHRIRNFLGEGVTE
jgi:internalin A